MHGMVDIITVEMENEQTKKIFLFSNNLKKEKIIKILTIIMIVILAIIVIVFLNLHIKDKEYKNQIETKHDINSIDVKPCEDYRIYKFISDYFKARTDLNFQRIFLAYGKDYYKEERNDKDGNLKKIVDNIRYERMFVKKFDNIKVYTENGYYGGETICIVTYDMQLGFTNNDKIPMIIIFYLKESNNSYIIKENFDLGTSKYIVDVINTENVKKIYDDVEDELNRLLVSNESLRLSYNSLRQYEINMNSEFEPIDKLQIIDDMKIKDFDIIKDSDEIFNKIIEDKEKQKQNEIVSEYIEKVVASLSDTQRVF